MRLRKPTFATLGILFALASCSYSWTSKEGDAGADSGGADTETDTETGSDILSDTGTGFDTSDTGFEVLYDFETDDGRFDESPGDSIWEWGRILAGPPEAGHGNVWSTNRTGTYGYCEEAFLTSEPFDASGYGGRTVTLSFDIWYLYEGDAVGYDGLTVEFYDGADWLHIPPVSGWDKDALSVHLDCPEPAPYADEHPGFTGSSGDWQTKTFSFTDATYPVDLRFRFVHGADGSNDAGTYYGAYIDNVYFRVN